MTLYLSQNVLWWLELLTIKEWINYLSIKILTC